LASNEKRVVILVEDLYEDLELWFPLLRLREERATVTVVGPKAGTTYKGKYGYPVVADWVDEPVVRDGNLVSSRKPDDLPLFCRTLIAALSEQD